MSKKIRTLNRFQKHACRNYGDLDFRYIADEEDPWPLIEDCGDTLFLFVMRELADDSGEEMDADTATQRMETAINDINAVMNGLEAA